MKRFLVGLLLLAGVSYAVDTTTTRVGITKPAIDSTLWGQKVNDDFDLIDSTFAALAQSNTFLSTATFNQPVLIKTGNPLRLYDDSTHYTELRASHTATTTVFTLPAADGSVGQCVITNGAGNFSFSPPFQVTSTSATVTGSGGLVVTSGYQSLGTARFYNVAGSIYLGDLTGTDAGINKTCVGSHACDGSSASENGSVAIGSGAGHNHFGSSSVAVGGGALGGTNTSGTDACTAIGANALSGLTIPVVGYDTAVGYNAGAALTTGFEGTYIGALAGSHETTPNETTAVGFTALGDNVTGIQNTAVGGFALQHAVQGGNVAVGHSAGGGGDLTVASSFVNGGQDIFIGYKASVVSSTTQADNSIAIGRSATLGTSRFPTLTTVQNAIAIGYGAVAASSNSIALGANAVTNSTATATIGLFTGGTDEYTLYVSSVIAHAVTAQGGPVQYTSRTLAQLKALVPTAVGQNYYCSDCATDTVCASTGTGTGAFSRTSLRTTACQ